jgi:hypothetical protein
LLFTDLAIPRLMRHTQVTNPDGNIFGVMQIPERDEGGTVILLQAGEKRLQLASAKPSPAAWGPDAGHLAGVSPATEGGEVHAQELGSITEIEPESRFALRMQVGYWHIFLCFPMYLCL